MFRYHLRKRLKQQHFNERWSLWITVHHEQLGDRFYYNAVGIQRSAINAPYITRITRHGAPKASHAALGRAEKKGEEATGTKEGRHTGMRRRQRRRRRQRQRPLTVSNDVLQEQLLTFSWTEDELSPHILLLPPPLLVSFFDFSLLYFLLETRRCCQKPARHSSCDTPDENNTNLRSSRS